MLLAPAVDPALPGLLAQAAILPVHPGPGCLPARPRLPDRSLRPLSLQSCAQVLLTLDNFANRSQYLNARSTFQELLKFGVIPIVNENVCCLPC